MEHVWKKSWIIVAHISEFDEIGSYRLFERLDPSIIIVRSAGNQYRAFHYVCRHRGAPLILKEQGTAKRFTCPYHAWTYNGDGTLIAVPDEKDFKCLDRRNRGLLPVRCEVWHGWIFINLDENADTLQEFIDPIQDLMGEFPWEGVVVKRRIVIEIDCNWKALRDNFSESYHVKVIHSNSVAKWLDSGVAPIHLFKNGHFYLSLKRRVAARIQNDAIPMIENVNQLWDEATVGVHIFPNAHAPMEPGGFPVQLFWPVGPDKSVMELLLVGAKEDEVNESYWDALCADMDIVVQEDVRLLSKIQRSIKSGYFTGMVLNYQERGVYWYNQEIDRRIGIDAVPKMLRIAQVMPLVS